MKVLLVFLALVAAYIVGMINILYMIRCVYPLSWCVLAAERETRKRKLEQARREKEEGKNE